MKDISYQREFKFRSKKKRKFDWLFCIKLKHSNEIAFQRSKQPVESFG